MSQFNEPLLGYRQVSVLHGDTLQRLALRELGDASAWASLAHINGLVPPYLSDSASPGVLAYGDQLIVPSATAEFSRTTDADDVFERDVLLQDGQIQVNESGDLSTVSGLDNLRQALSHRVRTAPGELIFHPEYRCLIARVIGTVNGASLSLLSGQYVRAALEADPRVSSVSRATAQFAGDTIIIEAEAVPIAGRGVSVSVTETL